MTCRQRFFKRALKGAREERKAVQILLSRGVKIINRHTQVEYRVIFLGPWWVIARWNGHHWRMFDRAATWATLNWRYGGN